MAARSSSPPTTPGSCWSSGGCPTATTGRSRRRWRRRSRTSSRARCRSALPRDLLGELVLRHVRAARDFERLGLLVELLLAPGVLEGARVRAQLEVVDLGALGVRPVAFGVHPALLALDLRVGLGELAARRLGGALLGGLLAALGARLLGLGPGLGARRLLLGVALALLLRALAPQVLVAREVAGRLLDPARQLVAESHGSSLVGGVSGSRTRAGAGLTPRRPSTRELELVLALRAAQVRVAHAAVVGEAARVAEAAL